jgi:hypothetical protein
MAGGVFEGFETPFPAENPLSPFSSEPPIDVRI